MASRDKMWPMTTFTKTREGPIDHLMCKTEDGQEFLAPVKVVVGALPVAYPEAARADNGKLIYVLPGGQEIAV